MINSRRILILGTSFQNNTGGGITLKNLFKNFDKSILFSACSQNSALRSDTSLISETYILGKDERFDRWPINKLTNTGISGVTSFIESKNTNTGKIRNGYKYSIKMNFYRIFELLGLFQFLSVLKVSDGFLKWFDEVKPDVVYTQLSSLDIINFVDELSSKRSFKLVIHIMDDWPATMNKSLVFRERIDKYFHSRIVSVFNKSSLLLSISEGMSLEYKKRYGLDFTPFHNPVEIEKWIPYTKKNLSNSGKFKILYTGRLGTANTGSISTICSAVSSLNRKKWDVNLEIYTRDYMTKMAFQLGRLNGINIYKSIPHQEIPKLLRRFDLLLMPLDFDAQSIRFAKLSMPTKISEYMISGVPIFIFAPEEMALINHAKKYNWAFTLTINNRELVESFLIEIITSLNERELYSRSAFNFAVENFDASKVRKNFETAISNLQVPL